MANEVEKVNTIEIADIEKIMGKDDDDIEKLSGFEFTGVITYTWLGSRTVLAGGDVSSAGWSNVIQYKTLASDANTSDFGDLNSARAGMYAGSNVSRGVFAGGYGYSGGIVYGVTDTDYVTVGSTGNGSDFGNLDQKAGAWNGGASNGTLLFCTGGFYQDGSYVRTNRMEYFTIASASDGTDAGNLGTAVTGGATASGFTRFLVWLGYDGTNLLNTVEYGTFHTSNDTSDFGDLGDGSYNGGMLADNSRAVTMTRQDGITGKLDTMEYFTVGSTGNATDFGDLTEARTEGGCASDGTRGEVYGGEEDTAGEVNTIEKITIQSAGDSADVGDLTTAGSTSGVCRKMGALSGT
jgi:hypothetical protein